MTDKPTPGSAALDAMEPGDLLLVLGGTFPGPNEAAAITVDVSRIIPVLQIVGEFDKHPTRPIAGVAEGTKATVRLERNDRRFGHDYGDGPNVSYGKRVGVIAGQVVDIWILNPMSQNTFYFIGKADELEATDGT